MKRLVVLAATLSIALAFSAQRAEASISGLSLLWNDSTTINNLEDQDYEGLHNNGGGAATVDVGDVLYGIWEISKTQNMSTLETRDPDTYLGGTDYIAAVFALEVLAKRTLTGTRVVWGLGPTDDAHFNSLTDPGGLKPDRTNSDAVIQIFSDPDGISNPPVNVGDIGGTLLWEWGFDVGSDPSSYYDDSVDDLGMSSPLPRFWIAQASTDDFTATSIGVRYFGALDELERFNGAFSLVPHNFGGLNGWATDDGNLTFPTTGAEADIHLEGNDKGRTGPAALPLNTNTSMYIVPTPEPASLLIWSVFGMGIVLMGWRRSRRG